MKIAIASGKGGTGKTLVATNLAYIAANRMSVNLYDLDVEEPNSHLFIKGTPISDEDVKMMIPVVDEEICNNCGICSKICEYHAIISLADNVLVFPELCHSCYGCLEMCPEGAISEGFKSIGQINISENGNLNLVTGKLKVSESATAALISKTKKKLHNSAELNIYDSPPGSSCPVIEATKDMDYIILVGEPTPFGLHDLDLVAQTVKKLGKSFGVIVNKAVEGNSLLENYCDKNNIEIIGKINQRMDIAQNYAIGGLITNTIEGMDKIFEDILIRIESNVTEVEV